MNPTHLHELVIGLDRSDQKADLHLIQTRTGECWNETLSTSPESRYLCRKFLRQSVLQCRWAAAYYQQQRKKGAYHHTAVRALAFKWQRIIWRCWHSRTAYQDHIYEAALLKNSIPLTSPMKLIELGKSPFKTYVNKT